MSICELREIRCERCEREGLKTRERTYVHKHVKVGKQCFQQIWMCKCTICGYKNRVIWSET